MAEMVGTLRYCATEIKREKEQCRLFFFFFLNLIQCVHALGPPSHISKTPYIGRTTLSSHGERHGALSHARRAPSWLGKCLIRIFNIVLPS